MSHNALQKKSPRLIHMDLLRLLAIYLVIFNHTGTGGYALFASDPSSLTGVLYMTLSVFCKIAVPLFFMISGALLLPKEESLKQLFSKRILRMAIVLLLVSAPYYLLFHESDGLSVSGFVSTMYSEGATTALWYIYSYIALLLMMPFLRSMVKHMKPSDFVYLIVGYIALTGVVPCLEYLVWHGEITMHDSFSPVLFVTQNVFFALVGYYVEHIWDYEKHFKRNITFGIVFSVCAIAVTCFMTCYKAWLTPSPELMEAESFFNCFICIPTITVYCAVKHLGAKIQNHRAIAVVSALGSAVFGVYLMEKLIRALTGSVYQILASYVGSMIASLLWCFVILCICLPVIVLIKHIPGLKKIVNKLI